MKHVKIRDGQVGLVIKRGNYSRVLTSGNYWLGFGEQVINYDLTRPFESQIPAEILLQDKELTAMLHVIAVRDDQIVIVLEKGILKKVLTAGNYYYWNVLVDYRFEYIDLEDNEVDERINKSWYDNPILASYLRSYGVDAYSKGLLYIDGVYQRTLGTGIYRYWKNQSKIEILLADMRQLQLEISGQELLTKDKAAVRINADIVYRVFDIEKALIENRDYQKQLYVAAQMMLRTYVGEYTLDDLLGDKKGLATSVFNSMKTDVEALGVKVLKFGIRDIILPGEMRDIMNQVLVAQKRAQANIITRREEAAATRNLLNSAKLMEESAMLYKLKEMEYVEKIADKIGEITVAGNGNMIGQLKEIFAVNK
ncbi:slipin family protein [Robertkochia solimangrovi]|uniref:slipin family protein n=1 Tax=Robertkochia solimangrovi TaxID=2213046 RepID=UPI00117F105A|nr:slipin family protein [Robertkochia solimangrovi]TRZ43570.1 slipin family protein [Robertkochia solimangrovi]